MSILAFVLLLQIPDVVRRAIDAIGGQAAIDRARSISVVMVGTQDSRAIAQGYFAEKSVPSRLQETLIVDLPRQRAAFRSEGTSSDGSPTSWRWMVTSGSGTATKLKTGRVSRMSAKDAAAFFERMRWHVPQLALADMLARAGELQCGGTEVVNARRHDVCRFRTEGGAPFSILFDRETGLLAGYEFTSGFMTGPEVVRWLFKPYVQTSIGLHPGGYRVTMGDLLFKDLDILGARPAAELDDHPWFTPPPADAGAVSTVAQQPPASVEDVAPGIWFLKNVGGYDVLFARVGDCVAVIDAPASFGNRGGPLPPAGTPPDLTAVILEKVREVTGKKVCYVIPTHHHSDHFGGIGGFARAGATIVTSPDNESLARRTAVAAGVDAPSIEIVSEKKTLGSGAERLDVWVVRDDPHAEEMVFVHAPEHRVAFEGDFSDYVLSAWNFLRFVERHGIAIERLYRSHTARPVAPSALQWEEPVN